MKILYLVSSLDGGGAEFSIPAIYNLFISLGHEVNIVALEPKDMKTAELLSGLDIPWHLLSKKRRSKLTYCYKLLSFLKSDKPDLIWCSLSVASFVGGLVGAKLNIPVVSFKHSASLRWYTKLTLNYSRFWIADSQAVADWLKEHSSLSSERILVWPFFRAENNIPRIQVKKYPEESTLKLLTVGRLHPVKNYDGLIKALGILSSKSPDTFKRLHLTIIGEGSERERLEQLISSLNLSDKISLLGHLEAPEIQKITRESDCYIQPSHYEGMCLALHEAMSFGLPAVASAVGQMRFSVKDGHNGALLHATDPASIASTLKKILEDRQKLAEMGVNAQKDMLENYSDKSFQTRGKQILKAIEEAFAQKK